MAAPPGTRTVRLLPALPVAVVLWTAPGAAQDANIRMPADRAERFLAEEPFEITAWRGARYPDDRTRQVQLNFGDSATILAKWLPAPEGGSEFNNEPRYELAAYHLQKLFLDPGEYVVPPTACRCVSLEQYHRHDERARATFRRYPCALVTLQYWLWSVSDEGVFDRERFRRDPTYARHLANADVLTHLIDHKDDNVGNFLISRDSASPRVFAVDNSVAFRSKRSNRGTDWGRLRVERLPAETVERLRRIDLPDLHRRLAVLAQFERDGDVARPVERTRPLDPYLGVRREDGILQLGLTRNEIEGVYDRIQDLLERVDRGDLATF